MSGHPDVSLRAKRLLMPFRNTVHPTRRLLETEVFGELNESEIEAFRSTFDEHEGVDPGWSHLVDFSGVSHFALSPEGARAMVDSDPWGETARRVLIAPGDLMFGMARLYQQNARYPDTIHVCRTRAEADLWLLQGESGTG